jgi:hypothetical protein
MPNRFSLSSGPPTPPSEPEATPDRHTEDGVGATGVLGGDLPNPLGQDQPTAGDQPGAFEHLEVLRHGPQADRELFGQLVHRRLAARKPREDGPSRRIGERGEGGAELVDCHPVFNLSVNQLIG